MKKVGGLPAQWSSILLMDGRRKEQVVAGYVNTALYLITVSKIIKKDCLLKNFIIIISKSLLLLTLKPNGWIFKDAVFIINCRSENPCFIAKNCAKEMEKGY